MDLAVCPTFHLEQPDFLQAREEGKAVFILLQFCAVVASVSLQPQSSWVDFSIPDLLCQTPPPVCGANGELPGRRLPILLPGKSSSLTSTLQWQ